MSETYWKFLLLGLIIDLSFIVNVASSEYIKEHIYDVSIHQDESLVNVSLVNNRWPDCTTLESAVHDMFRIEGVSSKNDQSKALALWKWFRILVSSTVGGYAYEEIDGKPQIVYDPHKILTVYGHHQCDGLSWAMVPLWRAAGYIAFDQCTHGHTIASLRYKDDDGIYRFHDFDPQGRFYWWDDEKHIVGVWSLPIMSGMVHRHLLTPINIHSLRTSLRLGETIERKWENKDNIVRTGDGIYRGAGEQVQTVQADTTVENFSRALYEGSQNTACSPEKEGFAGLHPKKPKERAIFIYRLAAPYVTTSCEIKTTLLKSASSDICALYYSTDGDNWTGLFKKEKTGLESITFDLGVNAKKDNKPNVYIQYNFLVKGEFETSGDVRTVGMNSLALKTIRMLNKRTLMNLQPDENYLRVSADKIDPKLALELEINYQVKGKQFQEKRYINNFPHYFKINIEDAKPHISGNYDLNFNAGDLQMISYNIRLVSDNAAFAGKYPSLSEKEVLSKFSESCSHPADMTAKQVRKPLESDPKQTSGFFPQSTEVRDDKESMQRLLRNIMNWGSAQELGKYPEACDALCRALPKANIDETLFIVKALAQIKDERSIGPLLDKWKRAPSGAPGTRYIPDALAAIGNPDVVPDLIRPLKRCRFDFRFHIAHALGILGGASAEIALEDLAKNDPFPAIRELAKESLENLKKGTKTPKTLEKEKISGPFRLIRAHEKAICPELKEAPTIDGNLDDKAWEEANCIKGFVPDSGSGTFDYATVVYFGSFKDTFYIGFDCQGQKAEEIIASDNIDNIWEEDSIEIFIDPQCSRSDYHQFLLNATGTRSHNIVKKRVKEERWESKAKIYENGWKAEVAIPFVIFKEKPKETIGFNLARNIGKAKLGGQWTTTFGDSHSPNLFSHLVFENEWKLSLEETEIRNFGNKDVVVNVELQLGENKVSKKASVSSKGVSSLGVDDIPSKGITSFLDRLEIKITNPKDNKEIINGEFILEATRKR